MNLNVYIYIYYVGLYVVVKVTQTMHYYIVKKAVKGLSNT